VQAFGAGALEATVDLLTLVSPLGRISQLQDVLNGRLTIEEFRAQQALAREQAGALVSEAVADPAGFATQLGKAAVDWHTWADDPARAAGRLTPDAALTVATMGAGSGAVAAERGALRVGRSSRDGQYGEGPTGVIARWEESVRTFARTKYWDFLETDDRGSWGSDHTYITPPKRLEAFPDAMRAQPRTPRQGGGGMRARWKTGDGKILEWDYQHGTVEIYDKRGRHLGEFDASTGKQVKPPNPRYKVEP
jgi:hypothetical protein